MRSKLFHFLSLDWPVLMRRNCAVKWTHSSSRQTFNQYKTHGDTSVRVGKWKCVNCCNMMYQFFFLQIQILCIFTALQNLAVTIEYLAHSFNTVHLPYTRIIYKEHSNIWQITDCQLKSTAYLKIVNDIHISYNL